jgi:hypothetical protein
MGLTSMELEHQMTRTDTKSVKLEDERTLHQSMEGVRLPLEETIYVSFTPLLVLQLIELVQVEFEPDDKENPPNFSFVRKWAITVCATAFTSVRVLV